MRLTKAFFCQINALINLYMYATAQLENVWCYGVLLENNYLAAPRPNLNLNDMLNEKLYAQNDATAPQLSYKC